MNAEWKVHTPNLLTEIVNNTNQPILAKPLNIFGKILALVGERASHLNDPVLNHLMCRLTIYEIADPTHKNYNAKAVGKIEREYRKHQRYLKGLKKKLKEADSRRAFYEESLSRP